MKPVPIPLLDRWPEELLFLYQERVAIKMDSGIPEKQAEEQALRETWARRGEA